MDIASIDQLRVLVTVAETGSFSAAARLLGRTQSAVSYSIRNLEHALGLTLFDRSTYRPTLTEEGRAILAHSRTIAASMGELRATAQRLTEGVEACLSIAIDSAFPNGPVIAALRHFRERYPGVQLEVHTGALWAIADRVLSGRCELGITAPLHDLPAALHRRSLGTLRMVAVVSRAHPLAEIVGPIEEDLLEAHTQLVIGDTDTLEDRGTRFRLSGGSRWRLADLHTKHVFLRAGFGWGFMPNHLVRADLEAGSLVRLNLAGGSEELTSMLLVHRRDRQPGPAGRFLVAELASATSASATSDDSTLDDRHSSLE